MRISYKWLQQYIDLNASIDEVAQKLTELGLEVEAVDVQGKNLDGFVVGEVLSVDKHPKADRLQVCTVLVAKNESPLQVVCGAPNVAIGQKVIVGLSGATVPHNQHDPGGKPFVLSKATIRGVESNGMICSAKELGIGQDGSGIMVLDNNASVGTRAAEYFGMTDTAMEIGITPNRPDCLSHIGIARDLAAVYGLPLKQPVTALTENPSLTVSSLTSVRVDNPVDCPRYTARVIRNITVKESPSWLKQLLTTAGLRPINNVVDITNYVMLEYGQPLHAFDFDNLEGRRIVVKNAAQGEKFKTLDGKEHTLVGDELMICDDTRSIAIGGVMGGLNSEISQSTTTVLLESAYFSPTSVRRTAKRLGISTDASYRFERGIDPNSTLNASERAAALISKLAGGEVAGGAIDIYPSKILEKEITVRCSRVNDLLGTELAHDKIQKLLSSIGINTSQGPLDGSLQCVIPTFRPDIEQEIDLVEEVARLYGYDNIVNRTSGEVMFSKPDAAESRVSGIRRWLESNSFNEVLTNSLLDSATATMFSDRIVSVKNPLSSELESLRPSMLSTMLQTVAHNYNHGAERLRIFEIGSTFAVTEDMSGNRPVPGYAERNNLGICLSGNADELSWHKKQRKVDIFDLKGAVLSLLRAVGLDNSDLIYYNAPSSLTEMTLGIEINGTYVGFLGRCRQDLLKQYKIDQDVYFAELDIDALVRFDTAKQFKEYSRFPTVKRDIAFVLKKEIAVGEIEKEIRRSGGAIVNSVTLFDLFEGASLGEHNKSVAFSLSLNSSEKTLTDAEIEAVMNSVIGSVTKKFEATLRSL
jgi:phenylalanyl-tRNA synthetase beta chain